MELENSKRDDLCRIPGIDEKIAEALLALNITLETLLDAPEAGIIEALLEVKPTPTSKNIRDWKDHARKLLREDMAGVMAAGMQELINEVTRILLGLIRNGLQVDPSLLSKVVALLLQDGVTADDPDLADKTNAAYKKVTGGGDETEPPDDEGEDTMSESNELFVRDIYAGNQLAHRMLDERAHILKRKEKDQDNELEPDLEQELIAAEVILGWSEDSVDPRSRLVIDPLFKAVQDYQSSCHDDIPDHADGKFPFDIEDEGLQTLIAMYGIMRRENQTKPNPSEQYPNAIAIAVGFFAANNADPENGPYADVCAALTAAGFRADDYLERYRDRQPSRRFSNALALAQAEYNRNRALFSATFEVLRDEDNEGAIEVEKWARVTATLADRGISATDPLLTLHTREALAGHVSADDGAFPSGIAIELPDLEAQAEVEIIQDNLHAMQAIYFAAMLDEANVFQVRDNLMSNFRSGLLPFGRGPAGDLLYTMIKESPNRLSEYDRRNLYARTLGFPGGDAHGMTNRDFQTLWLRFVSAVSSFARQLSVDYLLKADIPMRVRQEQVKKIGRDLAANLSLYGYGVTYFAATELQTQINEIIRLLSDDEVKSSYGARDMWGVVEQASALELGGARDTIRYRTMASAGAIIIRWLADHANDLADVGLGNVLDMAEIQRPRVRPLGSKPTVNPYDSDLVNACERWLAVTGTPDQQVENYAIPAEGPVQTSQPVRIPSMARDMLEAVGVNGFGS